MAATSHTRNSVELPYLRDWRLHHLLTQQALADTADVSISAIAHAETGSRVSMINARKLARAFGISVERLQHTQPEE